MKDRYIFLSLLPLFVACERNQQAQSREPNYELVSNEIGIIEERFDSTVSDENKYNRDNRIFKVGTEFTYAYEYLDPLGNLFFFKKMEEGWQFVTGLDNAAVKLLKIKVLRGAHFQNFAQTMVSYTLEHQGKFSISGVIENEANLWIHPPRDALFRVLELNPFPHVKYPLEIGSSWTGAMKIGDHWSDDRWLIWEGSITNQYDYKIIAREALDTIWGTIMTYKVLATAKSRLGVTRLAAWFHEELGFVRLNYVNIDGSLINFRLTNKSDQAFSDP